MSILSIEFVAFVLATVILYYIIPLKHRWLVLLAASCVFYALSGWQGCVWLVLVAGVTFLSSILQERLIGKEKEISRIEEALREAANENGDGHYIPRLPDKGWFSSSRNTKKLRKIVLAVSIILPFAAMAFTKYYDCLRAWITSIPQLSLIVPLGLSYFTFQSVGYMVDIYRGKYPAEKNPFKYLLFVSFFPQMTQGPISIYPQLMPQLINGNRFDPDNFVMGVQLALWGFFKKMVIADRLALVTDVINPDYKGLVYCSGSYYLFGQIIC